MRRRAARCRPKYRAPSRRLATMCGDTAGAHKIRTCFRTLRRIWRQREPQECPPKEPDMSTIRLHQTTTSTPEQFIAGLTDFGPGRSKLFGNSADEYLKVHEQDSTHADVTEGSGGIWERLDYDWSNPDRVVLTTTDSNVWGGASGHTYTFTRNDDGTTDIEVTVVRDGKNLTGWVLGFVLGTIGKRVLKSAFEKSVAAIERRYDPAGNPAVVYLPQQTSAGSPPQSRQGGATTTRAGSRATASSGGS